MICGVLVLKCRGGVGPLIAIPAGYVHPAKAMDSSSSSLWGSPNPHAQQQQRNFGKTSGSVNPAIVGRGEGNIENRGPTNTSDGVIKTTNVGGEMFKSAQISTGAKSRKGSFGGLGSALQKSSPFTPQAPLIQFGTLDFGDSSPSTSNVLSDDLPQLPNNVGNAHAASQQTVTQGWNKARVDHGLDSSQVLESKAPPPPLKATSGINPNTKLEVMSPKRPAERHLGGSERLPSGGAGRSSKDIVRATSPPPSTHDTDFPALGASSAAAGNRKVSKKGKGRGPADRTQAQAQAPLPRQHQEWKQKDEADGPASVQAIQVRERQSNLNQSRKDAYYDQRKAGDRRGAELGNGLETGGRRHDRHINQGSDGASEKSNSMDALGRLLTRILRHQAVELKLEMSSDGYVDVQDLLHLSMKTHANRHLFSHTIDDVKQVVQQDKKQRFGMKEVKGRLFIRANQGHSLKSLKSEDLLKPIVTADEIPVCVHGTYRKYLDQIFKEGLKTMERNHVHFASGLVGSEGVISGMRKTCEVLIYLNVEKALADGMNLYISENKVILTEGFEGVVPPEYFKEVLRLPDMKPFSSSMSGCLRGL